MLLGDIDNKGNPCYDLLDMATTLVIGCQTQLKSNVVY